MTRFCSNNPVVCTNHKLLQGDLLCYWQLKTKWHQFTSHRHVYAEHYCTWWTNHWQIFASIQIYFQWILHDFPSTLTLTCSVGHIFENSKQFTSVCDVGKHLYFQKFVTEDVASMWSFGWKLKTLQVSWKNNSFNYSKTLS